MRKIWILFSSVLLLAVSSPLLAGRADLGTITSEGAFRVNGSTVRGNATLLDAASGTVVETLAAPSRLRLNSGTRIDLLPGSQATVFSDRVVLDKGSSEIVAAKSFAMEARTLKIAPVSPSARATVGLNSAKTVEIAALAGNFRIHNSAGILVSTVSSGMSLAFEPQVAGQAVPSSVAGCVLKKDSKWVLFDSTAQVLVELRGTGFEREWGSRAQVNGTARSVAQTSGPAIQVLDVSSVTHIDSAGCEDVARQIGGEMPQGGARPTGAATTPRPATPAGSGGGGMSAGTKVAIVAAIGGGAAGAGIYATSRSK